MAAHEWDGTDRRKRRHGGSDPVTNDDLDEALALHSEQERSHFEGLIAGVMVAFPDGPDSHRIAHEQMIAAAKAEETFWRDLKTDVAKKSIWGILQILCFLAVAGLAAKFGLGSIFASGIGK